MAQRWTAPVVASAVAAIKKCKPEDWPKGVLAAVSKAVGFAVTEPALDRGLKRAQQPTPVALLGGAAPRDNVFWNEERFARACEIVKDSSSPEEAAARVSTAFNTTLSAHALQDAFRRQGKRLSEELKDLHPIEAQARRTDESRLRAEHKKLIDELRVANERNAFNDRIASTRQPPNIPRREKTSGLRDTAAVVLASDWHVEEEVDPESIAYRNEYNLEIAARRIDRFFNAIVWNVEHQRASKHLAVHDLILWLGGDLMSGYIHEELMEGNALSPTETCLWLLPRLNGGIRMLQERLDLASIVIPCSYGNHGRTTPKRRVATGAQNSYEWLMYNNLARELVGEKRIRFEITKAGHQYVTAYGFKIHFHHGDDVQFQGGVGGIGIPLNKAVDAWNEDIRCDIHNIGHWHQLKTFGSANVNGSLIGFNAYAKSIKARFEEPKQAFYLIDAKRGQTMWTPLWVGEDVQRKAA